MGQQIRLCTPDLASRATSPWSLSITTISLNSSERATWRRFWNCKTQSFKKAKENSLSQSPSQAVITTSQKMLTTELWSLNLDLNQAISNSSVKWASKSTIWWFRTTSTPKDIHNGSTSEWLTLRKELKLSLTCSTWSSLRVSTTKAWKFSATLRERRSLQRKMKKRAGPEEERIWATSKTTTEENTKRTSRDATTRSHSLTPLSTMMIKCISRTHSLTLIPIWLKTCAKSSRGSSTMCPETRFAELLLATNASIWPSQTVCHLKLTKRKKESWSVQESTLENRMPHGWWKESLTSWSAATLLLLNWETNSSSRSSLCWILMASSTETTDAAWQDAISTGDGSIQVKRCTQQSGTPRSSSRS